MSRLPLRILHVVPTYLPATRYGGPIYSVHGLARGLSLLNHEVHVFTTNVDGSEESHVPVGHPVDVDGVKVWYFRARYPRRIYRSRQMAAALGRTLARFNVVHLHSVFLWPTWAAARACRSLGVPYLISPRGMMVPELVRLKNPLVKKTWIRLIEKRNLERAATIHVTADIEAMELEKFGFNLPPIVTIPNGIATPSGEPAGAVAMEVRRLCQGRHPLILYLGRINWKKNLIELVRAMTNVRSAHLCIAGYDEDNHGEAVAEHAAMLGLQERISVLPQPIIGADKEALLAACDLFVLPSLSENFGNAALEAAIRGKPVVVSNGTGAATLVREYKCGLVCLPQANSIAAAILEILSDPVRARFMGERGRDAALRDYNWLRIAGRMGATYETIVRNRRQSVTTNDGSGSSPGRVVSSADPRER